MGKTLAEVAKLIKPGVTTKQLDKVAEEFIRDHGAIPTFKGFPNPYGPPFPGTLCTSVNDQVVHGIPNDIPLKEGDIVSRLWNLHERLLWRFRIYILCR